MKNNCFNIDLHVHTRRHSPCAESLDPEALQARMSQCNIHGVVLAEHNVLWEADELQALNTRFPEVCIYRGAEISCTEGHFVLIGLDTLDGIPMHSSIQSVIDAARRSKAAVIWVHPLLGYPSEPAPADAMTLPEGIDAIEVASTMTSGRHQRQALEYAARRKWHAVAGSDAHCIDHVGITFTEFGFLPDNEKELAKAIRLGLGIPRMSGNPNHFNLKK